MNHMNLRIVNSIGIYYNSGYSEYNRQTRKLHVLYNFIIGIRHVNRNKSIL